MYYTTSAPANCNTSGNYLNDKDIHLKTIINYTLPDVFCVNEIGSQSTYVTRILTNVLNTNGRNYYANCPLTNFSGGSIANMLYYDTRKLEYHSSFYVTTSVRDINGYKMYYKSSSLALGDTAFITFCVAHLKAGSYESDIALRKTQVERLTTKLAQLGIDNYIFCGDFNLYGASEPAYQHLLFNNNTAFRFYDPIDKYGNWNNNSQFANIHTQSTHTTSENGCFSTGGMDDRFDFILVSPTLFFGTQKVKVLPATYKALGQDGNRFNGTILNNNTAVPSEVANALYWSSDHLPVMCDFEISRTNTIIENQTSFNISVQNPIVNELNIKLFSCKADKLLFEIYSIDGKIIERFAEKFDVGNFEIKRSFSFPKSFYFLKITNLGKETVVVKLVK